MTITLPVPRDPSPEFEQPAERERLERVVQALIKRGFTAEIAESGSQARHLILETLPEGAEVHVALSETLKTLGIRSEIDESGRYDSVRARLKAMDRSTQAREMRKLGAAPDFMVGSANAVTDDGQLLVASGTGSQLGAYAYAAGAVSLVIGHQKIVRNLDEGLRRIREYSLPMEFRRMQAEGYSGSLWSETLVLHFDARQRVRIVLVRENLGF